MRFHLVDFVKDNRHIAFAGQSFGIVLHYPRQLLVVCNQNFVFSMLYKHVPLARRFARQHAGAKLAQFYIIPSAHFLQPNLQSYALRCEDYRAGYSAAFNPLLQRVKNGNSLARSNVRKKQGFIPDINVACSGLLFLTKQLDGQPVCRIAPGCAGRGRVRKCESLVGHGRRATARRLRLVALHLI